MAKPWSHSAVVNDGIEMLNEMLAGRKLVITNAYGGTGVVDLETETLEEQTGLVEVRQQVTVVEVENTAEGKIVCIQIPNVGLEEAYRMNQVAVYASLDGAEERMLFILQDETGADIPSEDETPDFLLEIYALIRMTNSVKLTVAVDGAGVATREYVQRYVAEVMVNSPGNTQTASGPPTADTTGIAGQHYYDTDSGVEYICKGNTEDGKTIWKKATSGDAADITYNGRPLNAVLSELRATSIIELTIPVAGWTEAETPTEDYTYICDVEVEGVTAEHWPTGGANVGSFGVAGKAGVVGGCETMDGYIRFYSKRIPTDDIYATIGLISIGQGGISVAGGTTTVKVLDQAEYDALEVKDETTLYFIRG